MKAKDLIAVLEALCAPDAEVFFIAGDGDVLEVGGGYIDTYPSDDPRIVLTTLSHDKAGGF